MLLVFITRQCRHGGRQRSRRARMLCFCADHTEGSHHGSGIEMVSPSGAPSASGSPKIGAAYTVVNVRPSDTGTGATAFSEGALSIDEGEDEGSPAAERDTLLQQHTPRGDFSHRDHLWQPAACACHRGACTRGRFSACMIFNLGSCHSFRDADWQRRDLLSDVL